MAMSLEDRTWSSDELIAHAHAHGYVDVNARRLETWRSRELLPRPVRVGQQGLAPVWRSPAGTEQRLLDICELSASTKDLAVVALRLWLRGASREPALLRQDLASALDRAEHVIDVELARTARRAGLSGSPEQVRPEAVRLLGERAGRARRYADFLPRLRSATGHRVPAVQALLWMFLTGQAPPAGLGTGTDVERALGVLPRGRIDRPEPGGTEQRRSAIPPWHDGQPLDLAFLGQITSLPAMRRALSSADDADFDFARSAVHPLTQGLSYFTRAVEAIYNRPNFLGLGVLRKPPAFEYHEALMVCLVLSLRQSELRENLEALVQSIRSASHQLRLALNALASIGPKGGRRLAAAAKSPGDARRMQALREEFLRPDPGPQSARRSR